MKKTSVSKFFICKKLMKKKLKILNIKIKK